MLKIEDLKYRDILVHKETGTEYEVIGFDSNGKEIIFSSGEVANDLKYFKKKEQTQQYTFDDLIDMAKKANKDRVIIGFSVVGGVLNCQTLDGKDYNLGIGKNVLHGIEYLQSLYKETFVIKCEEDIKLIRSYPLNKEPSFDSDKSPKATLSNGNVIHVFRKDEDADNVCVYMRNSLYKNYLDFEVLKGATVEQSKC